MDSMKTTIDIPDDDLSDVIRFTRVRTKREAVVLAIRDFNRRQRLAALARHAGTCDALITAEELQEQRRKD
jgi:Arc/MetJ family transcription regulator